MTLPGAFYDCYVLVRSRSANLVVAFLDHFLPARAESAAEYQVPQYSPAPSHRFQVASELLAYLEQHPNEPHTIYWRSLAAVGPAHAMACATDDGALILGLSCEAEPAVAERLLAEMKQSVGSADGAIWLESSPPRSASRFLRECVLYGAGTHIGTET